MVARKGRSGAGRGGAARPRRILLLHGPNLNLLGTLDRATHGRETLAEIDARLLGEAARAGVELTAFQSNFEGALIERVHAARGEGVGFIVVNPGSLAHTSVALRDALSAVAIPFIEVHLDNVLAGEPLRARSCFSDRAVGLIAGLGSRGYDFALAYALAVLRG